MSKSFVNAPKPRSLSGDVISAFERSGAGQDTKPRIPPESETEDPPVQKLAPPVRQQVPKESMRRLSVDLPASLHRRFKTACSATDRKMIPEVLEFIERRTSELETLVAAGTST
jgi:hypothetical protein